jgi:uncharacterized protein (TIGR03663 family)
MTKKAFKGLFLCTLAGALLMRVARLELRPMHHDEANQAVKFGDLLEKGEYRYDPRDHHGPSLYYLTLPAALAASGKSFPALSATTLRLVPALFGVAILGALLLLAGGLSREAIFFTALLTALSPAMTYYSRFYIQETLLVFFLALFIGAGWRYLERPSSGWAALAGLAAGMMYATKETSLILFGAAAAALVVDRLAGRAPGSRPVPPAARGGLLRLSLFVATALVSAGLLYTSFFTNPKGLFDSVLSFGTNFGRAAGAGIHVHPWYFYIKMLAYSRFSHGPAWSEAFILALAVAGGVSALGMDAGRDGHPRFIRLVLFFTVFTTAVYSAIPYKTPWNVLPLYLGVLILAGNGAAVMWRAGRFLIVKAVILSVLIPGLANLAYQDYRANFIDYAEPTNPYVYAQTSRDFLRLVGTVQAVAAVSPEDRTLLIKVVAPPDETWPLPWYLRGYARVGYWTDAGAAGEIGDPSLVIAGADAVETLGKALDDRYEMGFYGLRPEVVLALYVRQDLWKAFLEAGGLKARAGTASGIEGSAGRNGET